MSDKEADRTDQGKDGAGLKDARQAERIVQPAPERSGDDAGQTRPDDGEYRLT